MLENIGADDIRFTAEEQVEFNKELASIQIEGARLPKGVVHILGIEAPLKNIEKSGIL